MWWVIMVVADDEALSFKWRKSCYDSYAHALSRVHTSNVLMVIPGTISLETSKLSNLQYRTTSDISA
jgi:hypothetical protein